MSQSGGGATNSVPRSHDDYGTHQGYGDTFFRDEVFVKTQGKQHYLWRAVDQGGDLIEILVQQRKGARAAKRFLSQITVFTNRGTDRNNHGQTSQLRGRKA
ncbi:MAG: hypothetical protein ACI9W2_003562 [Gammaproteobacteria bacterium]